MREPTIARNYAETLVSLAERAGDIDGWGTTIAEWRTPWSATRASRIFSPRPR